MVYDRAKEVVNRVKQAMDGTAKPPGPGASSWKG